MGERVEEMEAAMSKARDDYSQLRHVKSEIENNYIEGVKQLNEELSEARLLVREKDEIIERIHTEQKIEDSQ